MAIKKIIQSGLTLGAASLLSVAPVLLGSTPAKAVTADGDIQEFEYTTQSAPLLTRGDRGVAVRDAQLFLAAQGYYDGPIDSIYGSMTENAVREFQDDNDLLVDGRIGDDTWAVMAASPSEQNLTQPNNFNNQNDNFLEDEPNVFDEEESLLNNEPGVFDAEDAYGNELGDR
ncbi:peptidoglycan-binding domain-containing protein [Oscillatoria salina]|uniref:peptidoglycan-binding domain-containing protein n=1 Tax=Oscillatoria salina TaxID=331517 RepID=UPI0013BAA16D|nr:peptidoglycan-binding domain-containing protein [Oscillatoria salina]MBZ8179462.1 peptidoglycan-binding protein [Oscillatoria salina IIICB1]NET89097.1 peptidoglycan-binding protein [Kamptonema sp. SIO1D9]